MSQWYVYPRTHIPSDMCIPPIWLPVKCVSPNPHPSKQVLVLFLLFLWILQIIVKGTTKDSRLRATQSDKRATIRDKIIAKLSLASLLLRGPQCWCKHSFSLLSLSNVIIIHMSLLALNKYDWQNFIQQGITRKVKKYRGDTHISAPGQWYVYPFLRAPQYSTFACCLIPVLTLVVSLVMLDDIDDISFSKRRYFLIVSWMSISVYCIPTRDTHITRDMCMGIHISRGYTYHCDTGVGSNSISGI